MRQGTSLRRWVKKNDADHGAGSQAIPEVVCKKGPSIEGWKFPSPGGVSVSVGERSVERGSPKPDVVGSNPTERDSDLLQSNSAETLT
ncbi:hypothetical protein L6452_32529 [Arctium lappa]|uniref:Uncharacterized protein n=1 Tax=Arctium lappa TaxID=4217 RepID=A0ACB8Z3Y6_ARCLA|nr:hypothetical protein L6452_32529 [Arctium lappa]